MELKALDTTGRTGGERSVVVVMQSQEKLFLDDAGFCYTLDRVITTDYDWPGIPATVPQLSDNNPNLSPSNTQCNSSQCIFWAFQRTKHKDRLANPTMQIRH